ncbi:hypothetical protein Tco_1202135 [Tanacetum coccineum]
MRTQVFRHGSSRSESSSKVVVGRFVVFLKQEEKIKAIKFVNLLPFDISVSSVTVAGLDICGAEDGYQLLFSVFLVDCCDLVRNIECFELDGFDDVGVRTSLQQLELFSQPIDKCLVGFGDNAVSSLLGLDDGVAALFQ